MATNHGAAQQNPDSPTRLADEAQTAEYIGDLLTELERLACGHGLVKLQYLLMESRDEARRLAGAI